jgi:hypothetical protein
VRTRISAPPIPPPDFYFPPKLGGDPDVPRPAVTDRTAPPAPRTLTVSGAKGLEFLPYGKTRVIAGGDSVLYSFLRAPNELWYVIPLGAGETGNLLAVNVLFGPESSNAVTPVYPINTSPPGIAVWFHNGAAGQAIDPNFAFVDPSWNEALAGSAYLVVQLTDLAFYSRGGSVPTLEVIYEGLKCLDPRDGISRYTTNTVLQLYDFARRREGKALAASSINTASIILAANIADEVMTDGTRRYESHVCVRDSTDVEDWIKVFRLLCDGFFTWRENQFHLVIDRPGSPSASFAENDLALDEPEGERGDPAELVNHIRLLWTDPANGWQEATCDQESTGLAAGLEERVTATYRLPWIHDAGRAKRLAIFLLNSFQFDFKLRLRWVATTTATTVGDLVTQGVAWAGIAPQTFRVLSRTPQTDNTYLVELGEYAIAKYSNVVLASSPKIASTLPDVSADPPALLTCNAIEEQFAEQSGVVKTRATLSWTAGSYAYFEAVEVLSDAGGTTRMVGEFQSSPAVVPLGEIEKTFNFFFRVRDIFGRRSTTTTLPFTALGKQLPPSNVPLIGAAVNDGRVTLRWQKSTDLDLLGYEVRRQRGSVIGTPTSADLSAMWEAAMPVGKVDGLVFEEAPPLGDYIYLVAAYDSGKRYSPVPAFCNVTSEMAGSNPETPSSLVVYNQIPGPDFLHGIGNMVVEGVNSGRLQFLLSRDDTWDDIASYMSAHGQTTLDAYDAERNAAELCFPLPANASGRQGGMGGTTGGTSTRNLEYTVRLGSQQRIGRTSFVESHQIASPFCFSQFGEKFTAGKDGMHPRFGLHLSTNDPWAQVIVRAEGAPIFFVSTRRLVVPLGEYSGTTGEDGRLTITLPPAKQLGTAQLVYFHARPISGSFVQLVPETRDNASLTVCAYDHAAVPLPGITVEVTAEDRGEGGTLSFVIF